MKTVDITLKNRIYRMIWNIVYTLFFRFSPRRAHSWRAFLLRLFGAKVGHNVHIYPQAKIWSPVNLIIGKGSSIDNFVDCYNVEKIIIGEKVRISRYSFLCTASHDYHDVDRQLIASSIKIDDNVWVAADVFIGPGVHVGSNSTILAKVTLLQSIKSNMKVKVLDNYSQSLKKIQL